MKHSLAVNADQPLRPAVTVTEADVRELLSARRQGLAGVHRNINPVPVVPASEESVCGWAGLSSGEKAKLRAEEARMFASGKIGMIVMAGGEATRFGGPKAFVKVSDELGDFLAIKAANLKYIRRRFGAKIPMYLLASEKRLAQFQQALKERRYYGLSSEDFLWYVQGTVDSFIPTHEEIGAFYRDPAEREIFGNFISRMREMNPDGIYRFRGDRRLMPAGHFDAVASFIISGRMTDALSRGLEYVGVFNIDNLQALLKNEGYFAHFAASGADFAFILAEKNLVFLPNAAGGRSLPQKILVRLHDRVISFDGIEEFEGECVRDGLRLVIDRERRTVLVFDAQTGRQLDATFRVKAETGGTLVQPVDADGRPLGQQSCARALNCRRISIMPPHRFLTPIRFFCGFPAC